MSTTPRAGCGQSREPGTPPRSPTRLAGDLSQHLRPPRVTLAESWNQKRRWDSSLAIWDAGVLVKMGAPCVSFRDKIQKAAWRRWHRRASQDLRGGANGKCKGPGAACSELGQVHGVQKRVITAGMAGKKEQGEDGLRERSWGQPCRLPGPRTPTRDVMVPLIQQALGLGTGPLLSPSSHPDSAYMPPASRKSSQNAPEPPRRPLTLHPLVNFTLTHTLHSSSVKHPGRMETPARSLRPRVTQQALGR